MHAEKIYRYILTLYLEFLIPLFGTNAGTRRAVPKRSDLRLPQHVVSGALTGRLVWPALAPLLILTTCTVLTGLCDTEMHGHTTDCVAVICIVLSVFLSRCCTRLWLA
jgi:hypothetical protein